MGRLSDEMYESFKKNLESVNGSCFRTTVDKLGETMAKIYTDAGIGSVCLKETELFKTGNVKQKLTDAGITVHIDHFRLNQETDRGGITENQYGIANLGTLVQATDQVDERIIAILSEYYIGVVKASNILNEYDDMFDILANMKRLPDYVGFITGPSRTADIECVSTVGVHGPLKLSAVIVDD